MQQINAPFEEHNVIGSHTTDIFPFVIWVMLDGICFAFAVWKDECDGQHIILEVDAPKIA